jgi:predicted GNAT family acetyltransferase
MKSDSEHDEAMLDETIEESFPASDPPANTVETGTQPAPTSDTVIDNADRKQFELTVDGHTAYLTYERTPETLTLVHTEVPVEIRGRHLGDRLVDAAVAAGRAAGLRLVVVCPFARAHLRRHGEHLSE